MRVLVTGASSGIGRATADYLAAKGMQVAGTSRNISNAPEGAVRLVEMDVTDQSSVAAGVKRTVELLGGIDVLVNNAGISHVGPFEETPEELGRGIMETNFFGVLRVTKEVLPIMREHGSGSIINVGSLGGIMGIPFQSYYVASKFALEGFCESIRMELRNQGIRVVVIEPGNIKTEINRNRKVVEKVAPHYQKEYAAARGVIEKTVEDAEPPENIARLIYDLIRKKKPKLRYPAGKGAGAISFAVRHFPQRTFEKILLKYYRQPK